MSEVNIVLGCNIVTDTLPLNTNPDQHSLLGAPGDLLEEVPDKAVGSGTLVCVVVNDGHVVLLTQLEALSEAQLVVILSGETGVGVNLSLATLASTDLLPGVTQHLQLTQVEGLEAGVEGDAHIATSNNLRTLKYLRSSLLEAGQEPAHPVLRVIHLVSHSDLNAGDGPPLAVGDHPDSHHVESLPQVYC